MEGPPGTEASLRTLFDVPLGWGVFAFMAISAVALLIIALPGVFDWYKANLLRNRNYGRWIEYSVSSSLMIVLIAMITGISDVAALIAIFGVNAAMILFGLLMEKYESPGKPDWLAYMFGCFAGAVPWIGIFIYLWGPGRRRLAARVRLRHLRVAVRVLQHLRAQHDPAVQAGRAVARLPVRREGLHRAQPDRQGAARLAGVLGGAGGLNGMPRLRWGAAGEARRARLHPVPAL